MSIVINCVSRTSMGKTASKALRKNNLIPGIVYNKETGENINISMYNVMIENVLKDPHFYTKTFTLRVFPEASVDQLKNLKVEITDKPVAEYNVIPKDIQFNVLTDRPSHLDFSIVKTGDKVKVEIPVKFLNREKNQILKFGGVLLVLAYNVRLYCIVGSIPEQIEIDVADLKPGKVLRLSDLTLPKNCQLMKDRDIAKISGKGSSEKGTEGEEATEKSS